MGAISDTLEDFVMITAHQTCGWADPDLPAPPDRYWTRSEHPPERGTERLVYLEEALNREAPFSLWVDFVPGLGAENGWMDYPETIPRSSFARCQVTAMESPHWLRVTVNDVIRLDQLESRIPAQTVAHLEIEQLSTGQLFFQDDWELLRGYMEDCEYWLLARRDASAIHLLASNRYCTFDQGNDEIWVGHYILTQDEWRRLCQNFRHEPAI